MPRTGTQALQRAVALLREVASGDASGVTLTELAIGVGLDRSTAHRLLQCLVREQLLTLSARSRRYTPGTFARELGLAAANGVDVRQLASPIVADVVEKTGAAVFIVVRHGADAYCVSRADGAGAIKSFVVDVGTRRPLGVGAASLALLAALPDRDFEQVLEINEPRWKQFKGFSAEQVRHGARVTRMQTYSLIDAVNVRGLKAVGVAVPQVKGMPSVALSGAAIAPRLAGGRERHLASVLHEAAAAIQITLEQCITKHPGA